MPQDDEKQRRPQAGLQYSFKPLIMAFVKAAAGTAVFIWLLNKLLS